MSTIIEINAALLSICRGEEVKEASEIVIDHYQDLSIRLFGAEISKSPSKPKEGDVFEGNTEEMGNVKLEAHKGEETGTLEIGHKKERVGMFRLWRQRQNEIRFHQHWASLPVREGGRWVPVVYVIRFNPKNLRIELVGRIRKGPMRKLVWRFFYRRDFIEILYSYRKKANQKSDLYFIFDYNEHPGA
jgi:hypothetical protein